VTPPNLSRQAVRDIEQAVDDMIEHGAPPAYAERFAVAVAQTAEKIARRPMLGHRRLELLPERFRFWAVRGFDDLLVYNAEHPERRVLRVVHTACPQAPELSAPELSARDLDMLQERALILRYFREAIDLTRQKSTCRKQERLFFSEEKKQKTFTFGGISAGSAASKAGSANAESIIQRDIRRPFANPCG